MTFLNHVDICDILSVHRPGVSKYRKLETLHKYGGQKDNFQDLTEPPKRPGYFLHL